MYGVMSCYQVVGPTTEVIGSRTVVTSVVGRHDALTDRLGPSVSAWCEMRRGANSGIMSQRIRNSSKQQA